MPSPSGKVKPSLVKSKARGTTRKTGLKAVPTGSAARPRAAPQATAGRAYKFKATSVEEYAALLPASLGETAIAADTIMRNADPLVRGAIKWGCPHYYVHGAPTKGWHHIMGGMHVKDIDGSPAIVLSLGARTSTGEKLTREMTLTSRHDVDADLLKRYTTDAVALVQSLCTSPKPMASSRSA
jgi:hypothetical protein